MNQVFPYTKIPAVALAIWIFLVKYCSSSVATKDWCEDLERTGNAAQS